MEAWKKFWQEAIDLNRNPSTNLSTYKLIKTCIEQVRQKHAMETLAHLQQANRPVKRSLSSQSSKPKRLKI